MVTTPARALLLIDAAGCPRYGDTSRASTAAAALRPGVRLAWAPGAAIAVGGRGVWLDSHLLPPAVAAALPCGKIKPVCVVSRAERWEARAPGLLASAGLRTAL